MRRALLSLLVFACLAAPVLAEGEAKPKKPQPGTTVEMPLLMAPMSQDGRLQGYAFITSKLVCTSMEACGAVREKLAFIQDANVRDVYAQPVALASNPLEVDRDLLNARLTANARRVVGNAKVKNMVFLVVQYVPLRPSESTTGQTASEAQAGTAAAAQGTPASGGTATEATGTAAQTAATSKPPAK